MRLTSKQIETLGILDQYQGKRVLVITSQYEVRTGRLADAIPHKLNPSTLRGLAQKGLLKVEPMWRGAWVTVPKRESLAPEIFKMLCL